MIGQDVRGYEAPKKWFTTNKKVLAVIAAVAGLIGYENTHLLLLAETGEFVKDGKVLSATEKKGFHFTMPFSGTQFAKWSMGANVHTEYGGPPGAANYKALVISRYPIPLGFQMEDHTTLKSQLEGSIGHAFNTYLTAKGPLINQAEFSSASQEFCQAVFRDFPPRKVAGISKPPEEVRCDVKDLRGPGDVRAVFTIRK